MKKKIFLPSIGLMALLAACSNDELFENKPISVDNNGRPTVNLVLGAELPEMDEASTRVVGGTEDKGDGKWGFDWYWETNDVLGAGLFEDYATGNVTNGEYQTNYAFLRTDENGDKVKGATFGAKSPVTVGSYVFYRPYNPSSARAKIGHTLTENGRLQKLQCGEKGMEELGNNNNFFFSPLYKVDIPFDEDKFQAEATKLPVKFASAYSYLRIILGGEFQDASTGSYWGKMKISKVELSPLEEGKEFVTSFTVNPQDVAAIQYDWAIENNRLANVDKDHGTLKHDVQGVEECAEEIVKALKKDSYTLKNSFIINGKNYSKDDVIYLLNKTTPAQTAKKLIYELDGDGFTYNKEGDEFVLYIPVPSGTYAKGSYDYKLNGASQKGEGVFMLEVYTSEGKATFILGKELETVTFNRDSPNRFSDKLYIKADESNIDFYAYNESGIDVATEAEWKYALDFIEGHSQIFNNKTPRINLNGDIKVNSLPEYKLQIVGEKTITLEGGAFKLNPEKTFLGEDGKNVPTLEVAQNTTLSFAKDIEILKLINNGTVNADQNVVMQSMTSYEGAELNISEGKNVIVNANTTNASAYNVNLGAKATFTVNAKDAAVNGTMTVENGAAVTLNGTTANATNNVTLKPASTLTVNNGEYTTSGTLAIQAVEKNISTVNVTSDNTVNEGAITVGGKLTAKALTNAQNASLTVNAATCEGRDISGTVALKSLTNNGNVVTEEAETTKNYFGGTIDVETLNNNNVINTNGELVVTTGGTNTLDAEIVLLDDRYSLIQLPKNYTNNGVITISKPENYCMFTYYKQYNKLNGLKGTGTIEATIKSQEQYKAVLAQQAEYLTISNDKYTAWDVINKFYVTSATLELTNVSSKIANYKKDIVLENTKVTIVDGLVVDQLIANNTTELTANGDVEFTANNVIVNKDRQLTIGEKVKLHVVYKKFSTSSKNYMMNIAGKLTNYGWIDTDESNTDVANNLSVLVQGELLNNGKLSQKAIPGFLSSDSEYKFVQSIKNTFFDKNGSFLGTTSASGKRIMRVPKNKTLNSWADCGDGISFTKEKLAGILKSASSVEGIGAIFAGDNWAGMIIISGSYKYILHDGNHVGSSIFDKYTDTTAAKNALTKTDKGGIYLADVVFSIQKNAVYGPTWFYIYENTGIVDLLNKEWAYGEIVNGDNGTLKGQWSKSK